MTINTNFTKQSKTRDWSTTSRRASDRPDGHSIVYIDVRGESVLENMANRRNRPYNVLRPLVAEALTEHGIAFTKLRWSQHAGCTCPCSPGFIIDGGPRGYDFWLQVTED